jgi:hypothetical protein
VRVFEVTEEDGSPVGLYLLDLYARESERGGAWMNSLVDAASLTGTTTAVVVNNLNVPKPAADQPTLLTYEATETLLPVKASLASTAPESQWPPTSNGAGVPRRLNRCSSAAGWSAPVRAIDQTRLLCP